MSNILEVPQQQVAAVFEEERKTLGPLPASVYESYQEGRRRVQCDSFTVASDGTFEDCRHIGSLLRAEALRRGLATAPFISETASN